MKVSCLSIFSLFVFFFFLRTERLFWVKQKWPLTATFQLICVRYPRDPRRSLKFARSSSNVVARRVTTYLRHLKTIKELKLKVNFISHQGNWLNKGEGGFEKLCGVPLEKSWLRPCLSIWKIGQWWNLYVFFLTLSAKRRRNLKHVTQTEEDSGSHGLLFTPALLI